MKYWKLPLKIIVAAGLVGWLIESVDWSQVVTIIRGAAPLSIAGYVLLQILGNLISAAKWRYLASIQNFRFSLGNGFFAYLTGAFINNFLPSTVGGDTYRVLWMAKAGERLRAASVILFDRITGLLALFLFAGIGLMLLPSETLLGQPAFIMFAAITLSVAALMLSALFWAERFYALAVFLTRLFPWEKPVAVLNDFGSLAKRGVYAKAILFAALFTVVGIGGSNFLLFSALGADIAPLSFAGAIFAATLVANIPISINNIGVKEWSYIFFFGLVGVSPELAVTVALSSRLLQMFISLLALPHYLKAKETASFTSPEPRTLAKE